jgi:outer membrane protein assembly factor BamB
MMKYRLSLRAEAVFAAAILGACAGAAYHHERASGSLHPPAPDALVGARARGRPPIASGSGAGFELETAAGARPSLGGFWTLHEAGAPFHLGTAIATDAAGRVHVAGLSGAGSAAGGDGLQATVARLLPDGGYAWSRTCAGGGAMSEPQLAVGPLGEVVLALTFQGSLDCGEGRIVAAGGDDDFDGALLKLDPAGGITWVKVLSDIGAQAIAAAALDPWGGVVFTGSFEGTVDLDGPPLTAESERDILLARLDADGALVWQRPFGATGRNYGVDVDVAPSGRIVLLARASTDLDFGAGELAARRTSGFVAGFDIEGRALWSRKLGGTGEVFAAGVAASRGDRVVVAGGFTGEADLGAGLLTSAGGSDVFVVKLGASGEALWSARFGDEQDQSAFSVASGPGGRVALTGRFRGALDFGQGAMVSEGSDLFVAKLASSGRPIWSLRTGDPALSAGLGITIDGGGQVLATGATPRGVAPSRPATVPASTDLFAARLGQ